MASTCNTSVTAVKLNAINSADIMPLLGQQTTGANANTVMRNTDYNWTATGGILPTTFPCNSTPVNAVANAVYIKYG